MKKISALMLALALGIAFTGCKKEEATEPQQEVAAPAPEAPAPAEAPAEVPAQ